MAKTYCNLCGVLVVLFMLGLFPTEASIMPDSLLKENEIQKTCSESWRGMPAWPDAYTEFVWLPGGKKSGVNPEASHRFFTICVEKNSSQMPETYFYESELWHLYIRPYILYWVLLVIAILDVAFIIHLLRKAPKDEISGLHYAADTSVQVFSKLVPNKKEEKLLIYAAFWRRFLAFLIDDLLISGVIFVILWIAVSHQSFFTGLFIVHILRWVYYAGMESSPIQATIGKVVVSIAVTDLKGARISFGRATLRYFSKILSQVLFFGGYAMAAFSEKKQGLHDKIASTLVLMKDQKTYAVRHPLYDVLESP